MKKYAVPFPRFTTARLNNYDVVLRGVEVRANLAAIVIVRVPRDFNRRIHHCSRDAREKRTNRGRGNAAVADREVWPDAASEAFRPVTSGRDIVGPEDERHTCPLDDTAENAVRPGRVADHTIERARPQKRRERLTRASCGRWCTETYTAEIVDANAGA